jgi:serine/threonine-protein kinase ATR
MISVLLSHLQNPAIISNANMIPVNLPSDGADSFLGFNKTVLSRDVDLVYTYTIRETRQGIWHLCILLNMLVDISVEAGTSYDATSAFEDYVAWLLDAFFAVHEMQKRWASSPKLLGSCNGIGPMVLCAIQPLLSSLKGSISNATLRKGLLTLSIILADLLDTPAQEYSESTRLSICRSILNLTVACQQYNSVSRSVFLYLLPVVRKIMKDQDSLSALGDDFQVCLSFPFKVMG